MREARGVNRGSASPEPKGRLRGIGDRDQADVQDISNVIASSGTSRIHYARGKVVRERSLSAKIAANTIKAASLRTFFI